MAATTEKIYYKIGEACKELDIQPYVLRYWETEFPLLNPDKSKSGQRVYSREDLRVIRRIKELLYEEGYTIAGAKKKLETELVEKSRKGGDRSDGANAGEGENGSAPSDRRTKSQPSTASPSVAPGSAVEPRAPEISNRDRQRELLAPLDTSGEEGLKTFASKLRALRDEVQQIRDLLTGSRGEDEGRAKG